MYTQEIDLEKQLQWGSRYLDIRVGYCKLFDPNKLGMGFISTSGALYRTYFLLYNTIFGVVAALKVWKLCNLFCNK